MVLVRSIVARLRRLLKQPVRLEGCDHVGVGEFGERVAVEWLWASGRKVLYRNFRASGGGEVDVVVREGKVLCFVEVKTRRRAGFGRPLEAVDKEKQALIERGANEWLKLLGTRDIPWRFDVVEVILEEGIPPQVTLVEDAF